jgi:hypothetical protein
MLDRLLPERLDNAFAGHPAALWLFALLLLMKLAMSVNVIFNGANVMTTADGIPLASYPQEAARTVVGLFGIWGIAHLTLCLLGVLVLWRYRAMVPLMLAVLLLEHGLRRVYLLVLPLERVGTPPGLYVNLVLLAITVIGLLLSLWSRSSRG